MRWTVTPWGGSFHSDGQHVPAGWLRSQNLRKICESVLSVHTLPLFSLRAHTAPCWPGWAGFPRQLQVASGATKSPPSFSFEAMSGLTVTAFCLLGVIIYPCISLLVGVPQVLGISDHLLSSMGSAVSPRRLLFSLNISHMTRWGLGKGTWCP